MVFCSYGRKSIFSDKSDSVDNQFRMCRDYLNAKFPGQVDDIVEYSDEDYTGANTEHPGLQRMLSDIDLCIKAKATEVICKWIRFCRNY